MGSTSHVVRFIGGGELRYVYNSRGQVIELSSTGVRASVSPERVVMWRPDCTGAAASPAAHDAAAERSSAGTAPHLLG